MILYFDENLPPQLAKAINLLQKNDPDYTATVSSITERFYRGIPDEEWIPVLGKENATIITQDHQLHKRSDQKAIYQEHGIGLVIIKPPSKKGLLYWEQVRLVIKYWDQILEFESTTPKPYCLVIKKSSGAPDLLYDGKNYKDK